MADDNIGERLLPESREGWRVAERQMAEARALRAASEQKLKEDPDSEEAWDALVSAADKENEARRQAYNSACGTLMFAAGSEIARDRRGDGGRQPG